MPQTQVKEYLSKVFALEHLLPDDILVAKLEQCLEGYRQQKAADVKKALEQGRLKVSDLKRLPLSTFNANSIMELPFF